MRDLSPAEIRAVKGQSVWDFPNKVLYDLCEQHPRHTRDDEIIAKIWLIGRSYAASIERRRNAKYTGDGFYDGEVAPALRTSGIDGWLRSFRNITTPGHPQTVVVHKRLTDVFFSLTDLEKRSLASKYLHFHRPDLFYLYDSRARQAVMKLTPRITSIPAMTATEYDWEYREFVRRCVWLRRRIEEQYGVQLSPRQIDKALLSITDGETRSRQFIRPGKP